MNRSTEVIGTMHTCQVMHLLDSLHKSLYLLVIIQLFELVALAKTQKKKKKYSKDKKTQKPKNSAFNFTLILPRLKCLSLTCIKIM